MVPSARCRSFAISLLVFDCCTSWITCFSRELRWSETDLRGLAFGFLHRGHRWTFPAAWNSAPHFEQVLIVVTDGLACRSELGWPPIRTFIWTVD